MISWMICPPCEITDQLAVGTQNCFSTLFYMPYTNIKTSAQNAPKCTIVRQKIKTFSGKGAQPPSQTPPTLRRGDIPSPDPTPSVPILAPSALGVPVPFHLRLEHWSKVTQGHIKLFQSTTSELIISPKYYIWCRIGLESQTLQKPIKNKIFGRP